MGISVTALVTALRVFVRLTRQRRLYADDYALLIAVAFYFALCGLYIADIPYLYAFLDVTSGKTEATPSLPNDFATMMKFNFAVTPFFWVVLWMVKASLLLFFRRVIQLTN